MSQTVRQNPRMTFSSLCEYLAASPVRQLSILRAQKFPKSGPVRSYQNALAQIGNFAVNGAPLNPNAANLEPHEQEVVGELVLNVWSKPTPLAAFPATNQPSMVLNNVEISVFPDLLLSDPSGKKTATGSLKLYFPKSRELDAEVARWMASFLYQYKVQTENDPAADPELCLVYDVRKNEYFEAGKSFKQLFKNVEGACQFIAAVWGAL